MIACAGSVIRLVEFTPLLPAVCPQPNCLNSLSLSILICKMQMIILVPVSHGECEDELKECVESSRIGLDMVIAQ